MVNRFIYGFNFLLSYLQLFATRLQKKNDLFLISLSFP